MRVHEIAERLRRVLPDLDDEGRQVGRAVYRELARGRPASVGAVAERAGVTAARARQLLDGWSGVFRDDDGDVVGFWGLALAGTDHGFDIGGVSLTTWCAWDPLFLAPVLGARADVTSTCPVTGAAVTLSVGPDGVDRLDPPTAVLSMLEPADQLGEDILTTFCHFVRLFADRQAGERWIAEHPGTFLLSVDEGFELGRRATPVGTEP